MLPNGAKRLDCGAFTAALIRRDGELLHRMRVSERFSLFPTWAGDWPGERTVPNKNLSGRGESGAGMSVQGFRKRVECSCSQ
jgi:hypothetical protein